MMLTNFITHYGDFLRIPYEEGRSEHQVDPKRQYLSPELHYNVTMRPSHLNHYHKFLQIYTYFEETEMPIEPCAVVPTPPLTAIYSMREDGLGQWGRLSHSWHACL
jgi:hypothetical protein